MSAIDPNHTTDLPVGKPDEAAAATSDQSRQGISADPNATGAQSTWSYEPLGMTDGARSGSVVPAIPDYEIEGELGRGGMGVVYRARQTTVNRPVAIKMILGGKYTDPLAQARFLIEAEVIAAIQHPHVVQLFQFGRHDDQPFFVLEFVGGGSLAEKLKEARRFTPRDAAIMVAKLADGMAAAHQKGVVHRDLKPANVLLTEAGEPKITDFGLAKIGQSDMTTTGAVMGTPSYMSPEQAAGKTREMGTLTDVYALGAILYALTTGRPPFRADTPMATIQQVLTREPERPRAVDARIPRDLETICLKCLEKDAKKRYATALELAADLRAFLEGRPITARPVGPVERTWKWVKRNPAWTSGIAAALLLLTVATVTGNAIRNATRNATHAAGLVQSVLKADTAQVPVIVDEMAPYRKWTDPLLRKEYDKAPPNSRQQLHASLALLPVDAAQVPFLYDHLLDAEPQEILVIRDALALHKDELLNKLWAVVEKPEPGKEKQRLRAACALALYDPENAQWEKASGSVIAQLVAENPVYLAQWLKGFRPVRDALRPALIEVYLDKKDNRAAERGLATNILADYAADNAGVLGDLILDGEAKQFVVLAPRLPTHRDSIVTRMEEELKKKRDADVTEEKQVVLAKRQARAAEALLYLGRVDAVWPLLQHSPDPTVRSYLVNGFPDYGVDPKILVDRLKKPEIEVSERRALLLALGAYTPERVPDGERDPLLQKLLDDYENHPDAGVHGSTEWLLRQWGHLADVRAIEQRLRGKPPEKRQWYVNGQGQTFTILPEGEPFLMGSPEGETGRQPNENRHLRKIPRTFAVAAKPVTREQFERFLEANPSIKRGFFASNQVMAFLKQYSPEAETPSILVSWYLAAQYCNWLSKEEGIDEEQWCYPSDPKEIAEGMVLKPEFLDKAGYRLPTEAEWECAYRAGADTSRYYGGGDELLPKYAWYMQTSPNRTQVVGRLRPNDWGLFDMNGNVFQWCHNPYIDPYPTKEGGVMEDIMENNDTLEGKSRVLRGGSFSSLAANVRSAYRYDNVPAYRGVVIGFRPARTFR